MRSTLLGAAFALVIGSLTLAPVVYVLASSFDVSSLGSPFRFGLDGWRGIFSSARTLAAIANTFILVIRVPIAAVVAFAVSWLLVRVRPPGYRFIELAFWFGFLLPLFPMMMGWILLLDANDGLISIALEKLPFIHGPVFSIYSIPGILWVHLVLTTIPIMVILLTPMLRQLDASFEEAAMMSGAGPLRTFRAITLRMGLPGILALLLLVVIRAFESFEVPALVGLAGNVSVLTTDIYQSSKNSSVPNYSESGAYSVCLLLIVVLLLIWHHRLSRHARRFQTITGKGYRPRIIDLGRGRFAAAGLLLVTFVLVTALPVGMLVFTSLQPFYEGLTAESFGRFTLDNYAAILAPGSFRSSIANTLLLGAATATAVVPFTALCAWLAVRRRPGAWLLDQIATAPLIFPAIVMSVAFLQVFVNLPIPLYGTLTSVIIASTVRFLPYGMRYAYAGVLQIHEDLEDAAKTSGAGPGLVFVRVVLPLVSAALVSCWLFVFLLAAQNVALPLMLVGPGTEIVAVTLFDLWQNGQVTELAAMGVLWVALMLVVSACFHFTARRYQLSV